MERADSLLRFENDCIDGDEVRQHVLTVPA